MGKYDCTKAKDFLFELSRLRRSCPNQSCNNCAATENNNLCPLAIIPFMNKGGYISEEDYRIVVENLQKWSDTHPERRELTEDEVTVLKAMAIMSNKYIVKDKNGKVYVFPEKPHKSGGIWLRKPGSSYETQITSDSLFSDILSFDDEEPAEIEELLKCARK